MSTSETALTHARVWAPGRVDQWLVGAVLAAAVLRLVRLDGAPLWLDEVTTARWVALPWGESVRTVVADNHPPAYVLLMKLWTSIAGRSEWTLRLPSVAFSCAAVLLIALAAATVLGRAAARWAAWLAALSPYLLQHAQEARMYALVVALAALHLLLLLRFLTGATDALRWPFALTAAALVGTHYYAVFFVGGELLALMLLWRQPLRAWVPAALASGVACAGALAAAAFLARHEAGGTYDLGWYALVGAIWSMLSGYALLPTSEALHAVGPDSALPYVPLACVGALALVVVVAHAWAVLPPTARVVVATTLGATLAGPFAVRLALGVAVNPRYFMAGAPALLVLVAAAALPKLGRDLRSVAFATLLVIMAAGSALHLVAPGHGREDTRAAGAWLDAHVPADEQVLVASTEMADLASFHWPGRRIIVYPPRGVVVDAANARGIADQLPFPGPERAIVVLGRTWLDDPQGAFEETLPRRYATCAGTTARGIRILCLVNPNRPRLASGRRTPDGESAQKAVTHEEQR